MIQLSCPFCGKAELVVCENAGGKIFGAGDELFYVHCNSCWARGPYAPGSPNAIAAWNCRAGKKESVTATSIGPGTVDSLGAAAIV